MTRKEEEERAKEREKRHSKASRMKGGGLREGVKQASKDGKG